MMTQRREVCHCLPDGADRLLDSFPVTATSEGKLILELESSSVCMACPMGRLLVVVMVTSTGEDELVVGVTFTSIWITSVPSSFPVTDVPSTTGQGELNSGHSSLSSYAKSLRGHFLPVSLLTAREVRVSHAPELSSKSIEVTSGLPSSRKARLLEPEDSLW